MKLSAKIITDGLLSEFLLLLTKLPLGYDLCLPCLNAHLAQYLCRLFIAKLLVGAFNKDKALETPPLGTVKVPMTPLLQCTVQCLHSYHLTTLRCLQFDQRLKPPPHTAPSECRTAPGFSSDIWSRVYKHVAPGNGTSLDI